MKNKVTLRRMVALILSHKNQCRDSFEPLYVTCSEIFEELEHRLSSERIITNNTLSSVLCKMVKEGILDRKGVRNKYGYRLRRYKSHLLYKKLTPFTGEITDPVPIQIYDNTPITIATVQYQWYKKIAYKIHKLLDKIGIHTPIQFKYDSEKIVWAAVIPRTNYPGTKSFTHPFLKFRKKCGESAYTCIASERYLEDIQKYYKVELHAK